MSLKQIQAIFAEVLDLADPVDWSTVRYQETPGWDSLHHMAIVGEFEDTFAVMLDTDDVIDLSSFDKAVTILNRYGVPTE